MNGTNFRMPARRWATAATATVLAAGPATLVGAGSAHARTDQGRASAVVLRTGLDVSLLNKTVDVPLSVSLNEVQAPGSAEKTALSAQLDAVNGGQPFSVLSADVATAKATVSATKAEGYTDLAHVRLHVPGLPLLSLIEVDAVTSKATCEAGKAPVATSHLPGSVTVLGKRVTVTANGPTEVQVPGVGSVRLDLSKTSTTSRTAAATALELKVSVNPLKLNVADVEGTVTLAQATCESPSSSPSPAPDVKPQGAPAEAGLAETGSDSMTPYIAGGAVLLLVLGGGAVLTARRRRG
ncbi:LPXTG-motif cell wall anchor domain-containing protein [Streptomyces sp. 3213]|uniref:SCO1860 family LAETG-anchored protein n=1 Tax=Streptomyces sp. 3213.3 TaxID=1855348 RepID=UPI00089B1655|nr:SCO1860 family LAETG-anchored protein [Streptomyces sp. 3213.3]SED17439.1 LPXTG-motif cell wall anchor domain-containing protein [Streptomyces sp. 3213] [Streptomyces sp. 3213.3]